MENIIRFSVSLPENLLKSLDDKINLQCYASRSEFVRDLIREKIVKDSWEDKNIDDENAELIAVLAIIYDHHQTDLVTKKISIEHDANVNIICTNHIHLDHSNCLETSVLRGNIKKIEDFKNKISGLKGVKFTNLIKAGVPQN